MTRFLGALTYNWPLKLMAVALATLLYAALVIAQNAQTRDVSVPIEASNKPAETIVIGTLGEVSEIRYFVEDQTNVTITSANFVATVDLSQVQPGLQAQSVRVNVESADPRIRVISSTPAFVSVKLEKIDTKDVPVDVVPGPVPEGLAIDPPVASLTVATVRGAQSDVVRVVAVRAVVPIDNSGIHVDRDFALAPIDDLGERVREVEVEPASVHVSMLVFKNRTTASVPIVPDIVGSLSPGYEVERVTLSATVVSLQGEAADLATIANARTEPIPLDGRTADFDVDRSVRPAGRRDAGHARHRGCPCLRPGGHREPDVQRRRRPDRRPIGSDLCPLGPAGPTDDRRLARRPRSIERRDPHGQRERGRPRRRRAPGDAHDLGPGRAERDRDRAGDGHGDDRRDDSVGRPTAVGRRLTMARLFGTDGIRGVANVELKPTLAYALGRATAHQLVGKGGQLVVGQDTRRSGDMFVAAITAGATSLGADVRIAGCVPTPALAFLAGTGEFAAGIMVSASHNPAEDNGLKVLDRQGLKLDDGDRGGDRAADLAERGARLRRQRRDRPRRGRPEPARPLPPAPARAGRRDRCDRPPDRRSTAPTASGGVVGPEILAATGASVEVIHNDPDGININVESGATAPASLAEAVRERGADVGFALDGDADRLIAVDATRPGSSTATRSSGSSPSTGSSAASWPSERSSSPCSRTAGSRRPSRRPAGT